MHAPLSHKTFYCYCTDHLPARLATKRYDFYNMVQTAATKQHPPFPLIFPCFPLCSLVGAGRMTTESGAATSWAEDAIFIALVLSSRAQLPPSCLAGMGETPPAPPPGRPGRPAASLPASSGARDENGQLLLPLRPGTVGLGGAVRLRQVEGKTQHRD